MDSALMTAKPSLMASSPVLPSSFPRMRKNHFTLARSRQHDPPVRRNNPIDPVKML